VIGSKQDWWAFEAGVVEGLRAAGHSQRGALELIGLSRGSWQLRTRGSKPGAAEVIPHDQRRSAAWLSQAETAAIVAVLTVAFALGRSVYQAFYEALDAGRPVASLSSWYRVARRELEPARPTRRRAKRRSSAMPQWQASGPMKVWSWDITKLKGPYKWVWYDFYVVIDVFSRKIVGWRIEQSESSDLAQEMFETAIAEHGGVLPRIVHSDGGSSMTSRTLTSFFKSLCIETSRNRPRVSNDNPFSESWFKTSKYSPTAPAYFTDIEHARTWAADFVPWYNTEHRHSGLEGHTPTSVHDGTWIHIHDARQAAMDELAAAHPHRYPQPVRLKTPYAHVTLNTEQPDDRLRTA
jgi:putative transposase